MAKKLEASTSPKSKKVPRSFTTVDILDYIPSMAIKWMAIGIKLGEQNLVRSLQYSPGGGDNKLTEIFMKWEASGSASWQLLLDTLDSKGVELGAVARDIRQHCEPEYREHLKVARPVPHEPMQQTQTIDLLRNKLTVIRDNPEDMVWRKETEKEERIKQALDDYFAKHAELGNNVDAIEQELETLYDSEQLLLRETYVNARKEVDRIKDVLKCNSANGGSSNASEREVLFSKENIYHAMVCCEALEFDSPGDHFKDTGHSLECFSVSRPDCKTKHGGKTHGKFLVAKKRNVYFIAFQGIPQIAEWTEYRGFNEGIQSQADCIPWNCFVHLLRKGAQLIFTGFSMGASLACAVVASMLQDNLLSQEVITANLACITFGQPLIAITSLEKLFSEQEYLKKCFHYVYMSADPAPVLLLHALIEQHSTGLLCYNASTATLEAHALRHERSDYICYSSEMLDAIVYLQDMSGNTASGRHPVNAVPILSNLPAVFRYLHQVLAQGGKLANGHFYAVSYGTTESKEGASSQALQWRPVTNVQVYDMLCSTISSTMPGDVSTYWQSHNLMFYKRLVFHSYLDQQPAYELPEEGQNVPSEVPQLLPEIKSIVIHCYEKEICIMVSGQGLWFARDLKLDCTKVYYTHPRENTDLQFQVTNPGDLEWAAEELPEKMNAQLGSCLSSYVTKQLPVTVKNYSMSVRQAQLANLTPVDLIQIAMLSVALERRATTGGVYSERYHAVQDFFNTAMDVVPIESVVDALRDDLGHVHGYDAYGEDYYAIAYQMQSYCHTLLTNYQKHNPSSHLESLPRMGFKLRRRGKWSFVADDSVTVRGQYAAPSVRQGQFPISVAQQAQNAALPEWHAQLAAPVAHELQAAARATKYSVISGKGIKELFTRDTAECDPRKQVKKAREEVNVLIRKQSNLSSGLLLAGDSTNVEILQLISKIRAQAAQFSQLVDAFMKSQVKVPLLNSPRDTARALDESQEALGVWYLLGLNYANMSQILSDGKLVIDVINYLGRFVPENERMMGYSAKAQFINRAMSSTVSCSSKHVCYSLERQLKELCLKCGIEPTTTTDELCSTWETFFKERILSFVALPHRPLLARWIKWMLAVHDLRECLAKQTVIGVIGLMNSGKSTLMNKMFHQKIPSGTRECKRTTVPFLYNLGPEIEEMDIIDFPGVNDSSDDIRILCKVVFEMSQMVLFIVDYRNAHSVKSMEWLSVIAQSGLPTLICLTFGDRLFAEQMTERKEYPHPDVASKIIRDHVKDFEEKFKKSVGVAPPDCMLCSIATSNDSVLGEKEGRRRLRDAGIKGPQDIAKWILRVLNKRGQCDLSKKLEAFLAMDHMHT